MENDWKSSEIGGLDDAGADLATFKWTVSLAPRATRAAIDVATEVRTILQMLGYPNGCVPKSNVNETPFNVALHHHHTARLLYAVESNVVNIWYVAFEKIRSTSFWIPYLAIDDKS